MKNQKKRKCVSLVFFTKEHSLDKIRNTFSDSFRMPRAEGGNCATLSNQKCSVEMMIWVPSIGEEEKEFIQQKKDEACMFFSQSADGNEDIKINLCHHIKQCVSLVHIVVEALKPKVNLQDEAGEVVGVILEVMEELDGVFVEQDAVDRNEDEVMILSFAHQSTTARNEDDDIILSGDGSSELEFYFPFVLEQNPKELENGTPRQKVRRYENMKALFDKKIYVCELPDYEDDDNVSVRDKENVVCRLLGLLAISLYSDAMLDPNEPLELSKARELVGRILKNYAIENPEEIFTPEELCYIQDDNAQEETKVRYLWSYAYLYVLEWVLGLLDWEEPIEMHDRNDMVCRIKSFHSVKDICHNTKMRSKKEILDKADLTYRMNWAIMNAIEYDMTGPANFNHMIVLARYRTLNWLIGLHGMEWDDWRLRHVI